MKVLVLGVGNVLLRDEGIGVRVLEELERRYLLPVGVEALDGGTAGMELLDYVARRDLVILLDAVRTGRAPGSVVRLAGEEVPAFFRTRISPHQLGLSELLATLRVLGEEPAEIVLIGIEPVRLDTGLELSPEARAGLEEMLRRTVEELTARGLAPLPRIAPVCSTPEPAPWGADPCQAAGV